jgi:hypothetical protein
MVTWGMRTQTDVGRWRHAAAAVLVDDAADCAVTQLVGGKIERFRIDIAEQHAGSRFNESRRDRFADPGCGASYDGALALQHSHVQFSCNGGGTSSTRTVRLL